MSLRKHNKFMAFFAALMTVFVISGVFPAMAAEQEIVVLYTNDVHCGVDDNIGYAGLSLYKKQMLEQTPYVSLIDAGDAIQGAPIGTLSDGGYLVDIMNQVGFDVAIPGNHEFDYGMTRFLELAGQLDSGYISSNFTKSPDQSQVFAPYKIIAYGDTKIAYVGVSTPESFTKSTPTYFQDASGNYIYSFGEDETGETLYSLVQSAVDSARGEGAAYVVLVAHLGSSQVTKRWSSDAVLQNTTGIDACIDGHSHETIPSKSVTAKDGKQVTVSQTGTKMENIGKMVIRPDGTITTELVSEVPQGTAVREYVVQKGDSLSRIAKRELGSYLLWNDIYQMNRDKIKDPNILTAGIKLNLPGGSVLTEAGTYVDYDTDKFIKKIQSQYNETLKTVLGYSDYELTVNNASTGARAIRSAETNLGDLTADAYRHVLGADIGLSNGGGIRGNIKSGNITYNDTLTVFPYGNMASMAEVTGQQIKDALEMSCRRYPEENGGFLQVSGLTYVIDTSVASSVLVDDKENFIKVNGPYRASDIMVAGQPLDVNKTYTVASHDYLLKFSGDGMSMFTGSNYKLDAVKVDVDVLSEYINDFMGGKVLPEYADPAGQGRITIR